MSKEDIRTADCLCSYTENFRYPVVLMANMYSYCMTKYLYVILLFDYVSSSCQVALFSYLD